MASIFDYDSWQAKLAALELANEVGRSIMGLILKKPCTATQIAEALKLPILTVLYHLTRLEMVGLAETFYGYGKRLRSIKYYRATSPRIVFKLKGGEKEDDGEI